MMCNKFKLFTRAISYVLCIYCEYPSYTVIQQTWSCTCPRELTFTFEIIITHMMHDIVSTWFLAARKFCVVVDCPVKILPCTMNIQNCHLTVKCLWHNFGTILTIFTKPKYYFDVYEFYFQIINNCATFPSPLDNIAYLSIFDVRNIIAVEVLFMFSVPKFYLFFFFFRIERRASVTYNL